MTGLRAIQQVAYYVDDVWEAARRHSEQFGSGPFFVFEHIPVSGGLYRGRPAELDHTSAFGQWGEVMIEFVQQHDGGPSIFRDVYPEPGTGGLHHVAVTADDFEAEVAAFNAAGFETAFYSELGPGQGVAFIDTVKAYGHMVEVYGSIPMVQQMYAMVKEASVGFDGTDPVRRFEMG